jgi:hypothetical protein
VRDQTAASERTPSPESGTTDPSNGETSANWKHPFEERTEPTPLSGASMSAPGVSVGERTGTATATHVPPSSHTATSTAADAAPGRLAEAALADAEERQRARSPVAMISRVFMAVLR